MRKLLILPLLVLLTGCVTYYYPQTALQDGVYYAEDDPSYVVYSNSYAGVAYYPWSSLDYFYLGYYPYPSYGFGYGYGGGFSFGISYGYSPWYYPYSYYGYYSPWYASYHHYPYYPAWRPYHGYYSRGHHKYNKGYRGGGHDRYAGNDNHAPRNRGDENEDRYENPDERRNRGNQLNSYSASRVNRYVSTAPSGYSGNRGMVIRNRETTKIGKSRLEPSKSVPVQAASVAPSNYRTAQPNYRTRQSGGEVRYSAGAKQGRSRTGPVESSRYSKGIAISAPQPVIAVAATGDGGRSRQSAPARTSRRESGPSPSGTSNRSRSEPSSSAPSVSRHREPSQSRSSRRERNN